MSISVSQCWTSSSLNLWRPCVCSLNLSEFKCGSALFCLGDIIFLGVVHRLLFLQSFHRFLYIDLWASGSGFHRDIALGLQSLSLPRQCKKLLWWGQIKMLTYRSNRMSSLEVTVLLCSLSRTIVLSFFLGPWPVNVRFSSTLTMSGMGSSS